MKNYPLTILGLLLCSLAAQAYEKNAPEPSSAVRQRAQQVVPYTLDQALQSFSKTVHGGIQHVVAKSPNDTRQVKLIQQHLAEIANQFKKGDFSVTARVHGPNMPGLAQLKRAQPDDIKFEYKALPDGAQIHYTTEYPQFVQALHEWFDAQALEHDSAAIPEHSKHHQSQSE
ncbi:MAG: aspartate carbamoyltransferase [Methylobacter sp.]